MVDYTELRKKFKAKNPQLDEKRRKKQLAIKKIAREYEAKKAEIREKIVKKGEAIREEFNKIYSK